MMQSRRWRLFGILPLVGALVGTAGCTAETGQRDTSPTAKAAEAASARGPKRGWPGRHWKGFGAHRGLHGPEHLLRAALHELDLSDAQRSTIEGALKGLRDGAKRPPNDGAVIAALAEGVRAGAIDRTAIEAKLSAAAGWTEERRARVAEALSTLHATLTKEQRRKLVGTIAARMEEMGEKGRRGPWAGRGAHGPMGKHGERAAMGGRGMKGGPLGHLLRGIDLRDEQRAQIDKALEGVRSSAAGQGAGKDDLAAKRAEMRARLETFAEDRFDANAFVSAAGARKGAAAHLDRMIDALAAIVPILDEAQRNALADRLEKGPPAGKHRRGRRGHAHGPWHGGHGPWHGEHDERAPGRRR